MTNILITSAGRRVELVQLFQRALRKSVQGGKVIAADAQEFAPARFFADHHATLPRVDSPRYIGELKALIPLLGIDLVVPTIDPELYTLSKHRDDIERSTGAWVMVADTSTIQMTGDKRLTQIHVRQNDLLAPRVYEDVDDVHDDDLPVIVKPRAGSSSIGVNIARTPEQLSFFHANTVEPMIQELVEGSEYTVDCFSDRSGDPVTVVPRLRIATRGGEILKGKITKDREVIDATRALLAVTPMPGHSTIQCFKTSRGVEFIEINSRFGGGAPMSIQAGADSCANLLRILGGEALRYNEEYEDGLTFLRFDQSISIGEGGMRTGD